MASLPGPLVSLTGASELRSCAHEEQPPLRFAAGSDAVQVIAGKAAALRDELERWRELSASTDLVPQAQVA